MMVLRGGIIPLLGRACAALRIHLSNEGYKLEANKLLCAPRGQLLWRIKGALLKIFQSLPAICTVSIRCGTRLDWHTPGA